MILSLAGVQNPFILLLFLLLLSHIMIDASPGKYHPAGRESMIIRV